MHHMFTFTYNYMLRIHLALNPRGCPKQMCLKHLKRSKLIYSKELHFYLCLLVLQNPVLSVVALSILAELVESNRS